jgi:hypothetical protein
MNGDIYRLAAFVKRRVPRVKIAQGRKARETLLMWLSWGIGRGNVCMLTDPDGKILAAGMARPLAKPVDSRFPYRYDERGEYLFCEFIASKIPGGMKMVLAWAKGRWPNVTKLMFSRSKNGEKMKVYDFNSILEKMRHV